MVIQDARKSLSIFLSQGPAELYRRANSRIYRNWHDVAEPTLFDRLTIIPSRRRLRRRMEHEDDLHDIIATVTGDIWSGEAYRGYGRHFTIEAQQTAPELTQLAKYVVDKDPESVVELGTARGGTLYVWLRALSADQVVSVDLPASEDPIGYPTTVLNLYTFADNLHAIRARAQEDSTVQSVKAIQDDGIDFLFLDADHRYEGVSEMFEKYEPLMNPGSLLAIDDIYLEDYGVPRFWDEIKSDYDTEEIKSTDGTGIGLIRY